MQITNSTSDYNSYPFSYAQSASQSKSNQSSQKATDTTDMDYTQMIHNKIEDLYTKIKNGDTEPSYAIGAQSFTQREWDKLLEQVDKVQEEIHKLVEQVKERLEEEEEQEEMLEAKQEQEDLVEALLAESTKCTVYVPDTEEKVMRITWYTKDGIFCRQEEQLEDYLWKVPFTDGKQYEKVMEYLKKFDAQEDMSFAAEEAFWKDFLSME